MIALLGFPLGGLLVTLLIGRIENPLQGVIGGAAAGLIIGAAQWLALRQRLPLPATWIPASAVGMAVGVGAGLLLVGAETTQTAILLRAPLAGLALGIAQWLLLRRQIPSAWGWPVVTTAGFVVAWFITAQVIGQNRDAGFVVFGSSGALVYQALTGLVLWRLPQTGTRAARA